MSYTDDHLYKADAQVWLDEQDRADWFEAEAMRLAGIADELQAELGRAMRAVAGLRQGAVNG